MEKIRPIFVVGVGSPHGDDSLGWEVARAFDREFCGTMSPVNSPVPECLGERDRALVVKIAQTPLDIVDWVEVEMELHIIDACNCLPTGEGWTCWTLSESNFEEFCEKVETRHERGTHGWSLGNVLKLLRKLNRFPQKMVVWGIAGENFREGVGLSPEKLTLVQRFATHLARTLELSRRVCHA